MVVAVCFCLAVYAEETPTSKGRYLALGDSITAGWGLDSPECEGFAALAAEELGFALQNEAVSGSTSLDLLAKLQSQELDAAIAEAEFITITCGGNDLVNTLYQAIADAYNASFLTEYTAKDVESALAGWADELTAEDLLPTATAVLPTFPYTAAFGQALRQYEEAMFSKDGVIAYLRAHNADAKIYVLTQYNPYADFGGMYGVIKYSMDVGAGRLNAVILENAGEYTVVDVYTAFAKSEELLCNASDKGETIELDFHPNAVGHATIAKTVIDTHLSGDFSLVGYQKGVYSLRVVGTCPHLDYDRMELLVRMNGEESTLVATKAYRRLYGRVEGKKQTVWETQDGWLYCFTLTFSQAGEYTLQFVPRARQGNTRWTSKEQSLRVKVQNDGSILVIE